jgi:membrane protease YdiL (CAAX protease family)
MQTQSPGLFSSENQLLQLTKRGSRGGIAHLHLPGFLSPHTRAIIDRWIYPWLALIFAWLSPIIVGILVAIPMLLLFMLSGANLEDFVTDMGALPTGPANLYLTLTLLLSFAPIYFLIWGWLLLWERRHLWTTGLERGGAVWKYLRGFLLGVLMLGGSVGLAAITGVDLQQVLDSKPEEAALGTSMLLALVGVFIVLPAWLVQGGAEEVFSRGFLLPIFGVRYGTPVAILVTSLFFLTIHLFNDNLSPLALFNLALFGVFACLYALYEGSLWGVCALHGSWNWAQGNVFGLSVSGSGAGSSLVSLQLTGPDWWAGGAFGPEGGLAVTVVLVISCIWILLLAYRRLHT